jgi:hypothetical protein
MNPADRRITQHEQDAKARHLSAVQHVRNIPLPSWFKEHLEQSILPLLDRMGFDRDIAGSIFRISSPAWKSMGRATAPNLLVHPSLTRDIQAIRRDTVSRERQEKENLSSPVRTFPRELAELLRTIPASWIILPRALTFLTRGDSRCLTVYLQHLDRETSLAFEKILVRILIEFIGNYSLKFISSSLPKKQMREAIFYGYAAMFWKNLRQPPAGLEDLLVYRNYLSWARAFSKRASCKDTEKETALAEMEEMADTILPDRKVLRLIRKKDRDAGDLRISLRHGRPGINHAVRYFTMNRSAAPGTSPNQLSHRTLPIRINALFRELRNSYHQETPGTREFIHIFLTELKAAYSTHAGRPDIAGHHSQLPPDFVRNRMACLVQDFSRSLH